LIATAGDYQHLARAADLALAKPRLGAMPRISGARQRFPKIENVAEAKLRLIERFPDRRQRSLTRSHYLHCGGAPAGKPNAVVTAIFQPSLVRTKTLSDTPLEVVSFWVTV
jgi:hypothetical protein